MKATALLRTLNMIVDELESFPEGVEVELRSNTYGIDDKLFIAVSGTDGGYLTLGDILNQKEEIENTDPAEELEDFFGYLYDEALEEYLREITKEAALDALRYIYTNQDENIEDLYKEFFESEFAKDNRMYIADRILDVVYGGK